MPIKALSCYSYDGVIKVRVVHKYEVRHYQNERGEGDVLNLDLADVSGSLINAAAFH